MELRLGRGDASFRVLRHRDGTVLVADEAGHVREVTVRRGPGGVFVVETPEGPRTAHAARDGETVWVRLAGRTYRLQLLRRRQARPTGAGDLASPMPGRVQKVLTREGAEVKADDPLLVVEAMKMQLEIKAPRDGRVSRLLAHEGDQVAAGTQLVELES